MTSLLTSSSAPDNMPMVSITKTWEIAQDKIKIVKVIGKGAFGQVAKATVEYVHNVNGSSTVAVKMLKSKVFLLPSNLFSFIFKL